MTRRFPFFIPLCGIVAGILTGCFFSGHDNPGGDPNLLMWGGTAVVISFAIYVILSRKASSPTESIRLNPYHSLWIGILFYGIGILAQWSSRPFILPGDWNGSAGRAVGIVEECHSYSSGDLYVVKVSRLTDPSGREITPGNMRINLKTDGLIASPDEILTFPARFSRISDHPYFRPSGFRERMEREGRLYECRASVNEITICGESPTMSGTATRIRDRIAEKIEKSRLDRATSSFIISILLGDRSLLSDETFRIFSNAGAAHILALSGMHVAVVLALLIPLLFPLRLLRLRKTAIWVGILLIWIFAYSTGLAPSTTRACVMATFIALASSLQRKNSSGNALLAAACIILIFKPASLFNAGFQLSFVCVASILAFAGKLNPIARHEHPLLYKATALILVSMAATAGTWVLSSHYFGKVPLLFLPVNIFIIPLLPLYIWLAAAYTFFLFLGFDPAWMAMILDKAFLLFSGLASTLSSDGSSAILFRTSWPTVALWLGGILLTGLGLHRSSRRYSIIPGVGLLLASMISLPFLSTAQPDSVIFHTGRTHFGVTLYDGETPEVKSFPRYSLSRFHHSGSVFTIIDCDFRGSLQNYLRDKPDPEKDYLIIGSGAMSVPFEEIPFLDGYKKIILHPSVSRKMEKEFLNRSKSLKLDNIYCLRLHGPLEEIL